MHVPLGRTGPDTVGRASLHGDGQAGQGKERTLTMPVSVCLTEQPTSSKTVTALRKTLPDIIKYSWELMNKAV